MNAVGIFGGIVALGAIVGAALLGMSIVLSALTGFQWSIPTYLLIVWMSFGTYLALFTPDWSKQTPRWRFSRR